MEPSRSNIYYELIKEVGLQGRYQTLIIVFCAVLCFQCGFISLGSPYYFAIAPYTDCPYPNQGNSLCNKYVCSLPQAERTQFLHPQISKLKTLGNEFGDLHCQNSDIGQMAKGMPFLGTLIGALVTGILGDNIGRRLTLIICLVSSILGYLLTLAAKSLTTASIGLFAIGFGIQSCFNLALIVTTQVLQNSKRQKVGIIIQIAFCAAGIFQVVVFYLIKDWKTIFFWFGLIPLVACLAFNILFVKDTPLFLIKLCSVDEIRQNLRFIAEINQKDENFDKNQKLSANYIQKLKSEYESQINDSNSKVLTLFDLIRFKSLRVISICLAIVYFIISFLYYAPVMLINEFGFDFYMNGILINASELITYSYTYFYIEKIERRRYCLNLLFATFLCFFALVFVQTKQICTKDCFSEKVIMELALVILMKFCVALHYQIIFLHSLELYPAQLASIGMGINSLLCSIGPSVVNTIINTFNKLNLSIMILFSALSLLAFIATIPLKETFGQQPPEIVQEIACLQEQSNQLQIIQHTQ